jgi:hypothetical protein
LPRIASAFDYPSRPVRLVVDLPAGLAPALRSAIESWAKQQKDKPSRSEAIRRLIEFALSVIAKRRSTDE